MQSYDLSSSHVWMWELDHKQSWAPKNWCFWTVVFKRDSGESLRLQGDQTSQSLRKSVLNIHWKDWCWSWSSNTLAIWWEEMTHWKRSWCWEGGWEEKGTTEDEMVGWHHRLDGLKFEQTLGDSERQGSLACCSPWGCKELDMTERLNNRAFPYYYFYRQGHLS